MAERPEDLNLPITVVQRLIKEALPDGVIVAKEARQTISRASSVFVLYLTSCAVAHANKAKRKTLAVNDIIAAIGDMEFDSFVPSLNEALKFRKEFLAQNAVTKKSKSSASKATEEVDEDADNGGMVDVEAENEEELAEEEEIEEEVEEETVDEEASNDKQKDTPLNTSKQTNKKRKLETDGNSTAAATAAAATVAGAESVTNNDNNDYVEVEESSSESSHNSSVDAIDE